jgi:hypothetical protein
LLQDESDDDFPDAGEVAFESLLFASQNVLFAAFFDTVSVFFLSGICAFGSNDAASAESWKEFYGF